MIRSLSFLPSWHMNIQVLSILLSRCIAHGLDHSICPSFNRQISLRSTQVGSQPLQMACQCRTQISLRDRSEGILRPTPGLIAKTVNPSSARSCAYWTVNMLSAALLILYAGAGMCLYPGAMAMDPKLVDLDWSASLFIVNLFCIV